MFAELLRLRKHAREFFQYFRNHQYEVSPHGIVFPRANLLITGKYTDYINGVCIGSSRNLVVNEGLNHLLSITLLGGSQIPAANWYLGIGNDATSPLATWTGSNISSEATEYTSTTEGYTESTRPAWTGAADTVNTMADNSAALATFTINCASVINVNQAFLVGNDSVRGGTTGTLMSATKYAATRQLSDGDSYKLQYEVDLDAA